MKILKLQAENVKRLSVVEIVPRENGLVIVAGDNGQGKSSVLDSIMIALGGTDAIPVKPVRKGEDKAKVVVDLGDYVVTRTMTSEGGGQLVVRDKDSVRQSTPQAILDGLYGRLSFDPLEFRNQKPAQRSETLRALLGLDFSTVDKEIQSIFEERTVINRDVRSLQARVEASKEDPTAPKEEESTEAILEAQRKAATLNACNLDARRKAARAQEMVDSCKEDIDLLERSLAKMKEQIAEGEKKLSQLKSDYTDLDVTAAKLRAEAGASADIPLEPFTEKLRTVEINNAKVRLNKIKADLREQLKNKIKEAEDLSAAIERREKSKRDKIASTQFPVEGLSLSDTKEVLYNGIPFDQASTAEQLRISVAMGMAMNPKLRVLLIRQGNDLDAKNLALLAKMAEESDFQIWLEKVDPVGDTSIIIEDGTVKSQPCKKETTKSSSESGSLNL
jgi:DNA repair exonuclease SbcCD ATPase subunit